MKRIDRIDGKGNICEHQHTNDDATRTLCGLALVNVQQPSGNSKCLRCAVIAAMRVMNVSEEKKS